MRLRASLFTKILLWFFLNLVVLAGALFLIFNVQVRVPEGLVLVRREPRRLRGRAHQRRAAGRGRTPSATPCLPATPPRTTWSSSCSASMASGSPAPTLNVPREVTRYVAGPLAAAAPAAAPARAAARRPPSQAGDRAGPPPRAQPVFMQATADPTRYWAGVRLPVFEAGRDRPELATLLAVSDSMSGHGLFFDVRPWLLLAGVLLALSILLWVPFVRGLTGSLRR